MTAKYRFVRAVGNVAGFLSQNRASTDARNVLSQWQGMAPGRSYKIDVDEDGKLTAVLTFES
jgi:hypothetical protein